MLLITRRAGEKIMVGDDIVVHIKEIVGNTVRVGIEAPRSTPIYREEIWHAVRDENRAAAEAPFELPSVQPSVSRLSRRPCGAARQRVPSWTWTSPRPPVPAVADVGGAARDRLAAQLPGVQPRKRRRPGKKALLIGAVATAATAALLLKREKVTALLPGRSDEPAPPEPAYTPPSVSNYDASGPVANTATSVPVPPAYEEPTIDEAAEEAAAAAEAGNIGGTVSDYAGPEGEPPTPEEAPLAEAGEGEAEGQEQAEPSCATPLRTASRA